MKIKTKRGSRRIRNQRVISRRFVTTDYDGLWRITKGKIYTAHNLKKYSFDVINDSGFYQNFTVPHCTIDNSMDLWSWLVS